MTLYRVSIGTREYFVDVGGEQIRVNGEAVDADLVTLNQVGLYLLRGDGRTLEMHMQALGRKAYQILMNGKNVIAQVERAGKRIRGQAEVQPAGDLKAPMPGMIVQVLAQPGQMVAEGDTLVIMESMKMQMRIRAPFAGKVLKTPAEGMSQVEKGAVLVVIEKSS